VILLANGVPVEKFSDGTIKPPPCIAVPGTSTRSKGCGWPE
jgi:hypothetical protein